MGETTLITRLNRLSRTLRNRDRTMPVDRWLELCAAQVDGLLEEIADPTPARDTIDAPGLIDALMERLGRRGFEA